MISQLGHAAVDDVAGDRHEVGIEGIDGVDDSVDIALLDGATDVKIGDLYNSETLECLRQVLDRHDDIDDGGAAPGPQRSQTRESDGRAQQGQVGQMQQRLPAHGIGGQRRRRHHHQPAEIAQHRQREHEGKETDRHEADPGTDVEGGTPQQKSGREAQGQQEREPEYKPPGNDAGPAAEARRSHQPPAEVAVHPEHDGGEQQKNGDEASRHTSG